MSDETTINGDEVMEALQRIAQTKDGEIVGKWLQVDFVDAVLYHDNPDRMKYMCGKHDLASDLIYLSKPQSKISITNPSEDF